MARPKIKTNAQIKNDYAKKAYDDIRLQVKKGQKDVIRQHAESKGLSLNGYINKLISDDMNATQSDNLEQDPTELKTEEVSEVVSVQEIPIEELDLPIRTYNAIKRAGVNKVGDREKLIEEIGEECTRNIIGQNNYKKFVEALKRLNNDSPKEDPTEQ